MRAKFGARRPRRRLGSRDFMMIPAKWRQAAVLQICLLIVVFQSPAPAQRPSTVTVTIDASRSVNQFSPARALGAGVDGHEFGETLPQLSPGNVAAMRSAGLKPLSYRLRTEL